MSNSGLANSPLFTQPKKDNSVALPAEVVQPKEDYLQTTPSPENPELQASKLASLQASKQVSKQANKPANKQASKPANNSTGLQAIPIGSIRKALRFLGKDATTYRLTPEEKRELMDITHSYKVSGFKTTENEIVRIAINLIIEDHKELGIKSIIQRVLAALKD